MASLWLMGLLEKMLYRERRSVPLGCLTWWHMDSPSCHSPNLKDKSVLGTNKLSFQRGLSLTVVLLADRSETHLFLVVFHSKIVHLNIKPNPYKYSWDAKNSPSFILSRK